MLEVSVIIPTYNGEETISKLYQEISKVLKQNKISFEIIFIDDSSKDNSFKIINSICKKDKKVKGILLSKNYGQHNAIYCGIQNSKGKYVITMDDDLQHPSYEIPKVLKFLKSGYDVVYAVPKIHKHNFLRNFFSKLTKKIISIMMQNNQAKNINSFRFFKSELVKQFKNINNSQVNIDSLLFWSTSNFASIKVDHRERKLGKSGYTFFKLMTHTLNLITSFSSLPLKIATFIGLFISLIGFLLILQIFYSYFLHGSQVRGFYFTATIIIVFSGVQLLTLGIIGQYISLIYSKSLSRPTFVITKLINKNK